MAFLHSEFILSCSSLGILSEWVRAMIAFFHISEDNSLVNKIINLDVFMLPVHLLTSFEYGISYCHSYSSHYFTI